MDVNVKMALLIVIGGFNRLITDGAKRRIKYESFDIVIGTVKTKTKEVKR